VGVRRLELDLFVIYSVCCEEVDSTMLYFVFSLIVLARKLSVGRVLNLVWLRL
jgi:hypothetical protein